METSSPDTTTDAAKVTLGGGNDSDESIDDEANVSNASDDSNETPYQVTDGSFASMCELISMIHAHLSQAHTCHPSTVRRMAGYFLHWGEEIQANAGEYRFTILDEYMNVLRTIRADGGVVSEGRIAKCLGNDEWTIRPY